MSNLRYTLLVYNEDDNSVRHFFDNNFDVRFEKVREAIHFNNFSTLKTFVAHTEQSSEEQEMNSLPLNVEMMEEKLPEGTLVIPIRPVPFLGHRSPSLVPTIDLEEEQEREVISFSTKQLDKEKKPQLIEDGTSDDFIDVLNGPPEQVHTYDAEINGNVQQLVKNRKESVILNEKLVIKLSNDFEEIIQRPPSDVPTTSLEDEEEQEKIRLFKLKILAKEVNFPLIESTEMTNITLDNDSRVEDPQSLGIEQQNVDFQNPDQDAETSAKEKQPIAELHEEVTQIAPLNDVQIMEDGHEKSAGIFTEKKRTAKRSQVGFGHAIIQPNLSSRRIELGGTKRTSTNERGISGAMEEKDSDSDDEYEPNKYYKKILTKGKKSDSKRVAIMRKTSKNTQDKKELTGNVQDQNYYQRKREVMKLIAEKYRNEKDNFAECSQDDLADNDAFQPDLQLPPENRELEGVESDAMVANDQTNKLKRGNESRIRKTRVKKTNVEGGSKILLTEKENEENQRKEAKREYAREYMRNKRSNARTEEGRARYEKQKELQRIYSRRSRDKLREKIRLNLLAEEEKEKVEKRKEIERILWKKRHQQQKEMKLAEEKRKQEMRLAKEQQKMNGPGNTSGSNQVVGN